MKGNENYLPYQTPNSPYIAQLDANYVDTSKFKNLDYINNSKEDEISISNKLIKESEIISRQNILKKKIPISKYRLLSIEEKLIIDLPIIMLKLKWPYSAYCILHWLEGTGNEIEIPINFIEKYDRTMKVKKTALEEMNAIEYASIWDWITYKGEDFTFSNSTFLMYNIEYPNIQKSYDKAKNFIEKIKGYQEKKFGNYNFLEDLPKMNFIRTYSIGSMFGDLDDLGASLGLFSIRLYIEGIISRQYSPLKNYKLFDLVTNSFCYRYFDEFSFNDEQNLGLWNYNIKDPEKPKRFDIFKKFDSEWVNLSNENFRNLKKKLNIGKDFNIRTNHVAVKFKKTVRYFIKDI